MPRCGSSPVASWARVNCSDTHIANGVCVCVLVLYRDFDEEVSGNYKKIYDVNASPSHLSLNRLFQKGCEMTLLGLSMFLLVQNSNDMHETRNYNNCIHYKRAYCVVSCEERAQNEKHTSKCQNINTFLKVNVGELIILEKEMNNN